jgi:hypothetical protein
MNPQEAMQALQAESETRKKAFAQEYTELEKKFGFTLAVGILHSAHGPSGPQVQLVPIPNWQPPAEEQPDA